MKPQTADALVETLLAEATGTDQLATLASEYAAGILAHYEKVGFAGTSIKSAVSYATQDWLNSTRGWPIAEVADDLEYWRGKWAEAAAR